MGFFGGLKETFDGVSKDVVNKVNATTSIAKLNSKIRENEQLSDLTKKQLGNAVYEAWNRCDDSPFTDYFLKLDNLSKEKKSYQDEIIKIQKELEQLQADKAARGTSAVNSQEDVLQDEETNQVEEERCVEDERRAEEERQDEEVREDEKESDGMICTACGTRNKNNSIFCIHCGQRMTQPQINNQNVCPSCGFELEEDDIFCTNCGHRVKA